MPRDKLCGGLLTKKTIDLLASLFPTIDLAAIQAQIIREVEFYLRENLLCRISPGTPCCVVDRKIFDYALLSAYRQHKAAYLDGVALRSIAVDKSAITLTSGDRHTFDYLIGADGALSTVRQAVDPEYRPNGYGLESFASECSLAPHTVRIVLGLPVVGYGWVFPRGNDVAVGLGGLRQDEKIEMDHLLTHLDDLALADLSRPRGAFVPLGSFVKRPFLGNKIFLIGDAAGLADPLTGEGLYYALKSAKYLAESISRAPDQPQALYAPFISHCHRSIDLMKIAPAVLYGKYTRPTALRALRAFPGLVRYIFDNIVSRHKLFVF